MLPRISWDKGSVAPLATSIGDFAAIGVYVGPRSPNLQTRSEGDQVSTDTAGCVAIGESL